jgi:hypothetical protein
MCLYTNETATTITIMAIIISIRTPAPECLAYGYFPGVPVGTPVTKDEFGLDRVIGTVISTLCFWFMLLMYDMFNGTV